MVAILWILCLPGVVRGGGIDTASVPFWEDEGPPYSGQLDQGSSAVSVQVGPLFGLATVPGGVRVGQDYNYSLNGPLLLSAETNLVLGGDTWGIQLIPGLKWRMEPSSFPLVPHLKGGVATELLLGEGAKGPVAVSARVGAGVRYFFTPTMGIGADWDLFWGVAAGDRGRFSAATGFMVAYEWLVP